MSFGRGLQRRVGCLIDTLVPQEVSSGSASIPDAAVISALRELIDAGGEKQYVRCRFGFSMTRTLVAYNLATIDDAPTDTAVMRITLRGRTLLMEK